MSFYSLYLFLLYSHVIVNTLLNFFINKMIIQILNNHFVLKRKLKQKQES